MGDTEDLAREAPGAVRLGRGGGLTGRVQGWGLPLAAAANAVLEGRGTIIFGCWSKHPCRK